MYFKFYFKLIINNIKIFKGISVKSIIQMCEDVGNMQIDKRKNCVEIVATHLRDALRTQRSLARRCNFILF